ncbi:MAG: hypothetical protein IPJ98_16620 [Bryobacterales bacterium]|nr:hypothetical protein [Bryobacterales bacterium]
MLRWKLSQFPASRLWQVGYAILILMAACVLQAEPFNTEGRKVLLPVDTQGVGHRFWSNGFLAVREIEKATVHLHNGEGKRLWTVRVTVPESVQTTLYPVTVWPDGSAAAAGGAVSADGARGPFLVLIDPAGKITRMVRTAPFVAQHLTVARDGSLWAFGRILSDWGEKKDKPHMMVRKYSRDGRELAAVLPRDTFPDWPHPARHRR